MTQFVVERAVIPDQFWRLVNHLDAQAVVLEQLRTTVSPEYFKNSTPHPGVDGRGD